MSVYHTGWINGPDTGALRRMACELRTAADWIELTTDETPEDRAVTLERAAYAVRNIGSLLLCGPNTQRVGEFVSEHEAGPCTYDGDHDVKPPPLEPACAQGEKTQTIAELESQVAMVKTLTNAQAERIRTMLTAALRRLPEQLRDQCGVDLVDLLDPYSDGADLRDLLGELFKARKAARDLADAVRP